MSRPSLPSSPAPRLNWSPFQAGGKLTITALMNPKSSYISESLFSFVLFHLPTILQRILPRLNFCSNFGKPGVCRSVLANYLLKEEKDYSSFSTPNLQHPSLLVSRGVKLYKSRVGKSLPYKSSRLVPRRICTFHLSLCSVRTRPVHIQPDKSGVMTTRHDATSIPVYIEYIQGFLFFLFS